jgi:PleD family two-component response regulator
MGLFVQHRPDILLLDLMMPEVSGFDILAEVRGHEELRYTPVIILTAESDPAAKLKALELGATDLLTKPVDPSELRLRLRNALAFKAYQDRLVDSDPLTGLPNRKKFR